MSKRTNPRPYKTPRLYVMEITFEDGRFVSRMLGVAFSNCDATQLRTQYKARAFTWWGAQRYRSKLVIEKLEAL